MIEHIRNEADLTLTENGAVTYRSTLSHCLDLFSAIGAMRNAREEDIISLFSKAFAEDRDLAMKILFYGRDVRGGLGERRFFRTVIKWLARYETESVKKNIPLIPEYGRYDDLLPLMKTSCEKETAELIKRTLKEDILSEGGVSLLAKWLPSVNASNKDTVRAGRHMAQTLGLTERQYRRTLVMLREKIRIIENDLRKKEYAFDYSSQPSKAMMKYRKAFIRNDRERYIQYLNAVSKGEAKLNASALMPYDIVSSCFNGWGGIKEMSEEERKALDVTWRSLEDFTSDENAIAVVDGSGSMFRSDHPSPYSVALSLGIYFAERNKGAFKDHFITFSESPSLVKIEGRDIAEKVRYCSQFGEVANTDLRKVFELILNAALKNGVPSEELPKRLYIISDMEFDNCVEGGDITNFEYARKLFHDNGYELPQVIFWNVASRNRQVPVRKNDVGAALVSGFTPRLFSMMTQGELSPYAFMMDVLSKERYRDISA